MKLKSYVALPVWAALSFAGSLVAVAAPAQAQALRTWVSGTGDDSFPCSRTAPCKTFAEAIGKTAAGGEIDCLDPGGYGTLTITKSITIDCTGTFGSTLNSGGINGIVINDVATARPGTIEVRLRGLSINGAGSTPGLNGIRFVSGRALTVEDVFIQNQGLGHGILIDNSSGSATVNITNTVLDNNGSVSGSGIHVRPTGTGTAQVALDNVEILRGAYNGVRVDASVTSGQVAVSINDSQISSNVEGISVSTNAVVNAKVMVSNSNIFNNSQNGILGNGIGVQIRVADTVITGNFTGVNPFGGSHIFDLNGNVLSGNSTDGAFN